MNPIPLLFALAMAIFVAFIAWYQAHHNKQIIGAGTVTVVSRKPPFGSVVLDTRDARVGSVIFREVRLPGGTWIDCAGDCVQAVRESREEFWDTQQPPRR